MADEGNADAGRRFGLGLVSLVIAMFAAFAVAVLLMASTLLFAVVGLGLVGASLATAALAVRGPNMNQGQRLMFGLVLAPVFGFFGLALLYNDVQLRAGDAPAVDAHPP